jgi:hypothetical protein
MVEKARKKGKRSEVDEAGGGGGGVGRRVEGGNNASGRMTGSEFSVSL